MLERVLEPEVMDTAEEARDYDAMDHSAVNRIFVNDFLAVVTGKTGSVLDVGTGTAQIPIELCSRREFPGTVRAIDLAEEMLTLAHRNVETASLGARIRIEKADAKRFRYRDHEFASVVSNSIIHHIPEPLDCIAEMVRVCDGGGRLFVRDLLRPESTEALEQLVHTYAHSANEHQRLLFANSLHAALTLAEVRSLVGQLGYPPDSVQQTSDRHWTWSAIRS